MCLCSIFMHVYSSVTSKSSLWSWSLFMFLSVVKFGHPAVISIWVVSSVCIHKSSTGTFLNARSPCGLWLPGRTPYIFIPYDLIHFLKIYLIAYLCYNCPISLPTLLRLWDLNFAILMGEKWYFIVVLVCISIIANEFEPLFLKKNISWLLMFPLLRNTYSRFYSIFIRLSIFFLLICRDLFYSLEVGLLWLYVLQMSLQALSSVPSITGGGQ